MTKENVPIQAGCDKKINNFSKDITDSVAYNHLMSQIAPKEKHVNKLALQQQDLLIRAEETLKQAEKLEAREFVTASDIVNGVEKLNLAFVANLFNQYPGLEDLPDADLDEIQETREEKSKIFSIEVCVSFNEIVPQCIATG